ncbi:MAG: hypothetical protein EP329_27575 [Deltaproteobacteria bacterium]|nr:MAG: hypothetical protein EP329_27575 [Deltaproteobacteria bacterium]
MRTVTPRRSRRGTRLQSTGRSAGARVGLLLAWLVAAWTAVGAVGCGTSCEEIARRRDAFFARSAHTDAPHATLTLPLPLADRLVADRLGGRASDRLGVDVLEKAGLHLGVVFTLDGVHFVPAADGHLGVEVEVGVRDGKEPLFALTLAADVRPVVDPVARVARVMLRPDHLRRIAPRLDPEGRQRVVTWLRRALPAVLADVFDDRGLGILADAAVTWLGDTGFPLVRDNLLDGLDESPLLEVALPELPLAAVRFTTTGGRTPTLQLELVTTLPVSEGLAPDHRTPSAGVVELRLAGETAAELANAAIARGEIPSRYTRDGEPSPDGPFEARLGWGRTPRPLKVHLWCVTGECTYVRLGGTPLVSLGDDEVRVAVRDGVFEIVKGDAISEAFAWTKTLFADPVRLGVSVARRVRLDVAGGGLELAIAGVDVGDADLRVALTARNVDTPRAEPGMVGALTPR